MGINLNVTSDDNSTVVLDNDVIYASLSGYGITLSYLLAYIALFVMVVIGLVLNIIVVIALKETSYLTDISRIFILNLACGDVMSGLIGLYLISYQLVHYKNYFECAFRYGILTGVYFNNIVHVMSLTYDRYHMIMYPFNYVHVFQEKSVKIYCGCVWILSGIVVCLPILGWRKRPIYGVRYCSYFGVMSDGYLITVTSFSVCIVCFVLFCYTSILSAACQQRNRFRDVHTSYSLWWGPTKTNLTLIAFYCCCWLPVGICVLLHLLDGFPTSFTDDRKGTVAAYCTVPLFLNTIGNPILYAVKYKTVKYKLMAVFCGAKFVTNHRSTKRSDQDHIPIAAII